MVKVKRKPGGGRKKGEPTKVIRVPVSKLPKIYELVNEGKIATIHPMP